METSVSTVPALATNGQSPSVSHDTITRQRDQMRQAMQETQQALQQLQHQQDQLNQQRAQASEVFLRQQGALQTLENLLAGAATP